MTEDTTNNPPYSEVIMTSSKWPRPRPLGYVIPETELELQMQKAFFRTNIRTLSDIIGTKDSDKRRVNTPVSSRRTISYFGTESSSKNRTTFGELLKYQMPVRERILSASKIMYPSFALGNRRLCNRHVTSKNPDRKQIHCDVFGPDFCADCSQMQRKERETNKNKQLLPKIETEARSLVVPEKIALLTAPSPKTMSRSPIIESDFLSYCSSTSVSPGLALFTENEVYERLRNMHKIKGKRLFGRGEHKYNDEYITLTREVQVPKKIKRLPVRQPSTDVNMKISISFVNY